MNRRNTIPASATGLAARVRRRLTPHPFETYLSPFAYDDKAWSPIPRTYFRRAAPAHPALGETQARCERIGLGHGVDLAAGHDGMLTHSKLLAEILSR